MSTLLSCFLLLFPSVDKDPEISEFSLARSYETPDTPASRIALILSSYLFHLNDSCSELVLKVFDVIELV